VSSPGPHLQTLRSLLELARKGEPINEPERIGLFERALTGLEDSVRNRPAPAGPRRYAFADLVEKQELRLALRGTRGMVWSPKRQQYQSRGGLAFTDDPKKAAFVTFLRVLDLLEDPSLEAGLEYETVGGGS
jgi:hypothetical protein